MTETAGRFASWSDVRETYENHITHYADHGGGEAAMLGLNAEGAVRLQYAGRVVYELFQNALDRADRRIVVRYSERTLLVGNDGAGFTVDSGYDYSSPTEGEGRSDFHALCALHTSNKAADRQFGNKGIGFRSVFGVSDTVTIWSRCADAGWWGLELRWRLVPSEWRGTCLSALDARVRDMGRQPRPSFHFPRLLRSEEAPHPAAKALSTCVLLDVDNSDHRKQVLGEVERLRTTRFQFVGLRRPGLELDIGGDLIDSTSGWNLVTKSRHHDGFPELSKLASAAGHAVTAPTLAVAWRSETSPAERTNGLFCNYLPSRMSTGLPIDVHGDFQMKADREGMALEKDNDVGRYNEALLRRAAEAHVSALRAEARNADPRPDFWQLAGRPRDASAAWIAALREELFPDRSLEKWTTIAEDYFDESVSTDQCQQFWNASRDWLPEVCRYSSRSQAWADLHRNFCDLLAEAATPVIPVESSEGTRAVPLPSRQKAGDAADRRVFFWREREDESFPVIPRVLLENGRVVTSFDLESFTKPAGVRPFAESDVLTDLRQVPIDASKLSIDAPLRDEKQASLLRFAFELTRKRRSNPPHFAWRAFADSSDSEKIGRALATLFLPTTDGRWEPARQMNRDRVDAQQLAEMVGDASDLHAFLDVLGVAPAGAIPLVEAGEDGLITPQPRAPRPQAPGNIAIPPLLPVFTDSSPSSVSQSVKGLPEDSNRSRVREAVRTSAWLDSALFRPYEGVPALPPKISPQDVVLTQNDRVQVFYGVLIDSAHRGILRDLGALERADDEAVEGRVADVLYALRSRVPDPSALPPSVALALEELFNRLMTRVTDEDRGVPALVRREGTLAWLSENEDAWIAERADRQELRRFFPSLPLVTAEHRSALPQALGVKKVGLERQVFPSIAGIEPTDLARSIVDRINPHIALLAAVADQSQRARYKLSPEHVLRAWRMNEPILQVADAWVELRATGPDLQPIAWRKNEFEDVFFLSDGIEPDTGVVIFDVPPDCEEPATHRLPLRLFGEALARLLTNNAALRHDFADVLAAIDEDRVSSFIERHHLGDLVQEWQQQLRPLSDEQVEEIVAALRQICTEPDRVLRAGRIRTRDISKEVPHRTAEEIEQFLSAAVAPEARGFLPTVHVRLDNLRTWSEWFARRLTALAAVAKSADSFPQDWKDAIEDYALGESSNIDFDPCRVATQFLARHDCMVDDLEAWLDRISPRFASPTSPPVSPSQLGWFAGQGREGAGGLAPHRKISTEDLLEEAIARGAVGDAGELALLEWAVADIERFREHPEFTEALLAAFQAGTGTWRKVRAALTNGNLPAALHIAALWSGAGFDVLGLEETPDGLIPVRYECKAISASGSSFRVHLSRNELAVARDVRRNGPGRWVLVGIQPDGQCVDLTDFLEDLIDGERTPLQPLHDRGLEPDGLRLVVHRSPDGEDDRVE